MRNVLREKQLREKATQINTRQPGWKHDTPDQTAPIWTGSVKMKTLALAASHSPQTHTDTHKTHAHLFQLFLHNSLTLELKNVGSFQQTGSCQETVMKYHPLRQWIFTITKNNMLFSTTNSIY